MNPSFDATASKPSTVNPRSAPGPKGVPFFGSVFSAWRNPLRLMVEAHEQYGDIVRFKFGPYNYYLVNAPDILRHVLLDNAKAYTKSRSYLGLKVLLGNGLLTSEGELWRRQRKLAQPAFHRAQLSGLAATMSRATREMLDRWHREELGTHRAFCVHAEMMRLTYRIVGLTLFSADVDGGASEVGHALSTALSWANEQAMSIIRIPPSVPTPANIRFQRALKTLDKIVYRLIADRRARAGSRRDYGNDLMGMLMAAVDDTDATGMSDRQLRDEVITMVLAGHETTANLLCWTFHLLAKHPEIEQRVREEARRVLGDRDPKFEDVRALQYTKSVLEETLRLYPPAWIFERQTTEADVLGGYSVPAGSIVAACPYVLHRHPRYWEQPSKFDPDRFRPELAENRPRYTYLPFSGGARTCIGNHFAMMEAQIILAMIVREDQLRLETGHPVELAPEITLRPKYGIRVRRRPADDAVSALAS
ncbi:MAG TPA: cytochrome P450 [Labilithrix sp.]|jgi:cytochrome P450|nr:cytochrome P450 [Labilithrix sp.]